MKSVWIVAHKYMYMYISIYPYPPLQLYGDNVFLKTFNDGGGGGGVMHGTKKRQKTDDLYHICIYDFPINMHNPQPM